MKITATSTAPRRAATVTAFWPGVKPAANWRTPALSLLRSVLGTRDMGSSELRSELDLLDGVVRGDGAVDHRGGHLGLEGRLGRRHHGVGEAPLPRRSARLRSRRGVLGLLERVDDVADRCGEPRAPGAPGRARSAGRGPERCRG